MRRILRVMSLSCLVLFNLAAADQDSVSDPGMGIVFIPPEGWKAQKLQDGYVLGSDTLKGLILIMPHGYNSLEEMGMEASEGIVDEEQGIELAPLSTIQPFGQNGLSGEFGGTVQGQPAKAYAVGLLSPKGGGVTILAFVETASYTRAYPQAVRSLAGSMRFQASKTAEAASGGTDGSLMQYFAGKYYSYSSGSTMYGGSGTERQVMLCPDGRYYDTYESSASGQGEWGAAHSRQGSARWSIQGNKSQGVITLAYPDGQSKQIRYQVTGEDGVILFEGIKFAFAGAPECR